MDKTKSNKLELLANELDIDILGPILTKMRYSDEAHTVLEAWYAKQKVNIVIAYTHKPKEEIDSLSAYLEERYFNLKAIIQTKFSDEVVPPTQHIFRGRRKKK